MFSFVFVYLQGFCTQQIIQKPGVGPKERADKRVSFSSQGLLVGRTRVSMNNKDSIAQLSTFVNTPNTALI